MKKCWYFNNFTATYWRRILWRRLGPIQNVDPKSLPALEAGDMVIVSSSHIAMLGSDIDWVVNRLLPRSPPGILVYFHDIFLPYSYPES